MGGIYISDYCVGFKDFELFERVLDASRAGAEYTLTPCTPAVLAELREIAPRMAKYPTLIHGPFVEVDISMTPDTQEGGAVLPLFREAAGIYRLFGATKMVMHTQHGPFPPEEKAARLAYLPTGTRALYAAAAEEGVYLQMENVGFNYRSSYLLDEDAFVDYIASLPPEGGCLIDIGHAFINGWDLPRVIARIGSRITEYHLHNNDGKADIHRPMFEAGRYYGERDYEAMFDAIARYTPDADLTLEYAPGPQITVEGVAADADKCRVMLADAMKRV